MTRKLRRKLKPSKQDLPPFQPLTTEDVRLIADAGQLDCADDDKFYDALDELRDCYRARYKFREMTITDRQFRAEIHDALEHLAGLMLFFSDWRIMVATSALFLNSAEQSGAVPDPEEPEGTIHLSKQRDALEHLESWVKLLNEKFEQNAAINRNGFSFASAANLALEELVVGLADVWPYWSNGIEIETGRHSPWMAFLRKSLKTIAQRDTGEDNARKLTRRLLLNGNLRSGVRHEIRVSSFPKPSTLR
jgi:hypothetical protein